MRGVISASFDIACILCQGVLKWEKKWGFCLFCFLNLRGFNRENFNDRDDGLLNVVLAAFHVVLVHVVNAAENL